ncbi:hypothetical protein [Hydrogenibacillus sp. N12]|uniref:hypothetical protein n=1 Tax=Hydrogenibacillus sp. N12 TaxID=2866627 RepID=UPI001C7D2C53|nr:hypothetical protein [Hydrogenibacillus sp. N12]QZA33853.1 hypothetical protein K2M58_04915 [Hydrogenibacillus sp. N12]
MVVPLIAYVPIVHPDAARALLPVAGHPPAGNAGEERGERSGETAADAFAGFSGLPASAPGTAGTPGGPPPGPEDIRRLNPTLPLILYPILVFGMLPWMHVPNAPSVPPYPAPYAPPPATKSLWPW